jgi:hypothetical protein
MGGVVFAPGTQFLSRFGAPISLAAGGVVPAGTWIIGGSWTVTNPLPSPVTLTCEAGVCVSDGQNVKAVAATQAFPLGA